MANPNNKAPSLYCQSGSVWDGKNFWDSSNSKLVKLKIYPNYLVVYSFGREIIKIHKSDVMYIQKYRWLSSIGLRIHHKKENEDPFIIFWTGLPNKMLSNLRKTGYEVREGEEKSRKEMTGFFKAGLINIIIPLVAIILLLKFFTSWGSTWRGVTFYFSMLLAELIAHFVLYTPRK